MIADSVLQVAVIGLGIGEQHVRAYQSTGHVHVRSVCDLNPARASEIAEKYRVPVSTTDWRDVIADPAIDLISVCSYDNDHVEQVVRAIKARKHVFVEKPICLSAGEADTIQSALSRQPAVKLSSNLPLRTCPRFRSVRDAIQDGRMGTVYHFEADYIWGRSHKLIDGWRRRMPFYSVVLGASIHMIDLLIWLKGVSPIEVSGYGSRRALEPHDLGFDDFAINLFRFADGTCAKVAAHGGGAHPHFHSLNVFGTKETFFHNIKDAFWVDDCDPNSPTRAETSDYPAKQERRHVLASFVEHIVDERRQPVVAAQDAFTTFHVALAADRAIREHAIQAISPTLSHKENART